MGKQAATRKPCTWEELSVHGKEDDCWIAVDGKVYDVTSWIPKHPGGQDLLLMCGGRDVTNLFESYHIMSETPREILKKYYICDIASNELPHYTQASPFYSTLKKRVSKYFLDKKRDPQNSSSMWFRYAFIYLFFITMYYIVHFGPFSSWTSAFFLSLLFSVSEVFMGMHILHDSGHAAITHAPKVWKLIGCSFDLIIGGSHYAWAHQHALGHHVYTNVRGADPDLGEGDMDFRRVSPSQEWRWFYKYQHIYAPILYGVLPFKARAQDWQSFVLRMNGPIRVLTPPTLDVIVWIIGKLLFIVLRFVLPLFFMPLGRLVLSFFVTEFMHGYYLALVFQVSHVAEGLDFHATPVAPAPAAKIDEDWAVTQVRTTQDYGHGSKITTYMTGALNYQTTHHLFPTINQDYYTEIAPIVMQTCKEFNIPYQVLPSFWSALVSHFRYLKFMGQDPKISAAHDRKKEDKRREKEDSRRRDVKAGRKSSKAA